MSNQSNKSAYVIVPVLVQFSSNGEVMYVEAPKTEDVQASYKVIGSVSSKEKIMSLLQKYGSMLKGFLK